MPRAKHFKNQIPLQQVQSVILGTLVMYMKIYRHREKLKDVIDRNIVNIVHRTSRTNNKRII